MTKRDCFSVFFATVLLFTVMHAFADEDPKPRDGVAQAPAKDKPKDEISEVESLRYLVAYMKSQEIQRQACEVQPACVRVQADLRTTIGSIDTAHHIDRSKGEGFNVETRAITRAPSPAPVKK